MRPRFMNRGSRKARERVSRGHPSFNEAPIHESGKYGQHHVIAQDRVASMRPRFMNRGSGKAIGWVYLWDCMLQ